MDEPHGGFHRVLAGMQGAPFKKAVSVACGKGIKEMSLIKAGVVERFDLYEISEKRIETGTALAKEEGIADRVRFVHGDAFSLCTEDSFDLVYWNNALHHMLDAWDAVRWSHDRLKTGGVFAMDDYIGASRFQWSDMALQAMSEFRAALPDRLLLSPNRSFILAREVKRPSREAMMNIDPSEAADSENILPALRHIFPGSYVIPTGGHIYATGLNNILVNFDEDGQELRMALYIDDLLSKAGENQYAVAFARKEQ